MPARRPLALLSHFARVDDPRVDRTQKHALGDLLVIALSAVLSGADSWVDVAAFGHAKRDWLKTFLDLPHGIPSHDTFGRVFALLHPDALQAAVAAWLQRLADRLGVRHVAIDGKTLRGAYTTATRKTPWHLVQAWASDHGLVLGQVAADGATGEQTLLPRLLDLLDLEGAVVTLDALGCQPEIARQIRQAGGDYVLAVKGNQPTLEAALRDLFAPALRANFAGRAHDRQVTADEDHGRVEVRIVDVLTDPPGVPAGWPDVAAAVLVYRETHVGAKITKEVRLFLGSLRTSAAEYARLIRDHWGIENGLHWVLDVQFAEDRCRARKDHGPANFAWLRRLALMLLKKEKSKASIRTKRLKAGWNDDYLLKLLRLGPGK